MLTSPTRTVILIDSIKSFFFNGVCVLPTQRSLSQGDQVYFEFRASALRTIFAKLVSVFLPNFYNCWGKIQAVSGKHQASNNIFCLKLSLSTKFMKIPSEMEVAPRYELLSLLSSAIDEPLSKTWGGGWQMGWNGYHLDCYDYWSTCADYNN